MWLWQKDVLQLVEKQLLEINIQKTYTNTNIDLISKLYRTMSNYAILIINILFALVSKR